MLNVNARFASAGTYTPDRLIAGNAHLLLARTVTLVAGAVYARGAVLGRVTVGGQYTLSAAAAEDGSETPDLVLAEDKDATGGPVEALAYVRGDFNANALTFGTGHTAASVAEALRTKGIALLPALA